MKVHFGVALALMAVVVSVGCQPAAPQADLTGRWMGSFTLERNANSTDAEAAAANLLGAGTNALELKSDGTYRMNLAIFPLEGQWKQSGSTVTLTPTKVLGKEITEADRKSSDSLTNPYVLEFDAKADTLTMREATKQGTGVMVYKRAETKSDSSALQKK